MPCGKFGVAHEVVIKLAIDFENKGHCIAINKYFISILLLKELLSKGIYGTWLCRANFIKLPSSLKNIQASKKSRQGFMDWTMH